MDRQELLNLIRGVSAFGLVLSVWLIGTLLWVARRARRANELNKRLALTDPTRAKNGRVLQLWKDGEVASTTVPDQRPNLGIAAQLDKMRLDAGWQLSMSATLLRLGGAAVVAAFLGFIATGTPLMIGAAPIAVGVVFWIYLTQRIAKRAALFERQLVDALELAARSLRVGNPLVGSFRLISEEIPAPVGELFGRVCQQQSLGVPMDIALRDAAAQSPSDDLRLFATSVVIQLHSGGNLADLMGRLSEVIRERNRLARRVRVLTAQTQLSKRVLLALPILAFVGLSFMNPDYMRPLYTTHAGDLVSAIAILGMFFGWMLMNWLGKVPVQQELAMNQQREQLIVAAMVFVAVIATGAAFTMLRKLKRSGVEARLQKTGANPASRKQEKNPGDGQKLSGVMGNIGTAVSSGRHSATLREQLIQAGYDGPNVPSVYLGTKMVLAVVGVLAALALVAPSDLSSHTKMIGGGAIVVGLFMLPNIVVSSKRGKRCNHIRMYLPHAIDLLEVCASSGMGMDMAWNSVGDEMRQVSPLLADEMVLANLEIRLGAARADAMRHMARRTGADELHSLAAVLVQSERFGTSMSEALTLFAQSMREARSHRAQEAAEKLSVKLMLPMLMFIFPALVLVTAGPAFILLYHALGAH